MKKPPSKVAHNRPPTFFIYWPGCTNGPETEILYHQKPLNTGYLDWGYVIKRQVNNQARLEYKFASSSIISMRKTWLILQRGEITSAMESLFFHLFLQDLSGFFILLETFNNISLKQWWMIFRNSFQPIVLF